MEKPVQSSNPPPRAEMNSNVPAAGGMNREKITQIAREIYKTNHFVEVCGIQIDKVDYGRCQLHMQADGNIHTNLWGSVHGGALFTLANTSSGVWC